MNLRNETSTNGCPSWDTLSCYTDAELPPAEAATVEHHLTQCAQCGALRPLLEAPLVAPLLHAGSHTPDCPDAETLLSYLSAARPTGSDAAIAGHMRQCDACVGRLADVLRNAQLDDPAGVPAALVARATAAAERVRRAPLQQLGAQPRPTAWLRLPVLLPLAFAAGIVVFVATQQLQDTFAGPGERWRAVRAQPAAPVMMRRVLTTGTPLREAAQTDADVVTELRPGSSVDIIAEQTDWLQIALPDGRRGWVSRSAVSGPSK